MKDTEYMYASAKIRAAEGRDSVVVRLEKMLSCRTVVQLFHTVTEFGFWDGEAVGWEDGVQRALDAAVHLVRDNVPEPAIYDFLLYKYDCNNLKVALKSNVLGREYAELYYSCGTFSTASLASRLAEGDIEGLPAHMGEAALEAAGRYAATGEGREIDFLLDRACFADMAENTKKYAVSSFRAFAEAYADSTNIRTSARLAQNRQPDGARIWMERAYVPGGSLPLSVYLTDNGTAGYTELAERLLSGVLRDTVERIVHEKRESVLWDEQLGSLLAADSFSPFGVHVPAVFLYTREMELKNCRVLAAGLSRGETSQKLRERVREFYA